MLKTTIESEVEDTYNFYGDFDLFYIDNKEDLSEFIKFNYKGRISETNKIPFKQWFIYQVDDSGDSIWDAFFLLHEFKEALLKNILDSSLLYRKLQEIK